MSKQHQDNSNPLFSLQDLTEDYRTASDALRGVDWKTLEGDANTLVLDQAHRAKISVMEQGAQWVRFRLEGRALRKPSLSSLLTRNAGFEFPAKFISSPNLEVDCVVDVPEEALSQSATQSNHLIQGGGSLTNWARGLTGALLDEKPQLQHAALEETARWLGQQGWSASVEGPALHVHLQLPNVYRRLQIEPSEVGYRVSAHLIPLSELSCASAKAVRRFSLEANRRLPLVRFSEDVLSEPPQLLAEVSINVALVPDVWLVQALSAVEAAVTTTSRELLALRDPELAQTFLAAF